LYFREQHPRCPESVPQHRESRGEERLFHLHEHLPLLGEELVQPFCFLYVVRGMDSCCYPEVRRTTLAEIDMRAYVPGPWPSSASR